MYNQKVTISKKIKLPKLKEFKIKESQHKLTIYGYFNLGI